MASDPGSCDWTEPLPYHLAIRDYLKREQAQVWSWFASNRVRKDHVEALRFDLLKSTYRVDRGSQPELYAAADEVAKAVSLTPTITIYQAQSPQGLNASLVYIPDEAHIVLHGPVQEKLADGELRALLAHELGHMLLYGRWDEEMLVAEQVLAALTHDPNADTCHFATARLFALYTEVFCDRVALGLIGEPYDVVSMLVKVSTGVENIDAKSYLKQADEVLAQSSAKAEGHSHPEAYIRAYVLDLWRRSGREADARVAELIEGAPTLDELDLLAQERVMANTRRLLDMLLAPTWLRTDCILAHARLFFDGYEPTERPSGERLRQAIDTSDKTLQDYYCYVMLDFASADRDLEEAPLAHALGIAGSLGLEQRFNEIAVKELRLRKRQMEAIASKREQIVATAAATQATS